MVQEDLMCAGFLRLMVCGFENMTLSLMKSATVVLELIETMLNETSDSQNMIYWI